MPNSERGEEGDGNTTEWLIALTAAAGALVGERLLNWNQQRRALNTLLKYVRRELTETVDLATHRSERPQQGSFPFDSPIRTEAWQTVRDSDVGWRLVRRRDLFEALTRCYDAVASVNHQREAAAQMFGFAQTAGLTDDEARSYIDQAMRLVTEPYTNVLELAGQALDLLPTEGRN